MTLRKRILATGAVAVGAALALAGCSGSSGGGGGTGDGTVNISGAFTGQQATAFQTDLDNWSKTSKIKVKYNGSSNFQTSIVTQVKGGTPPDIAIYPQPGVLKSQISSLKPLNDLIDIKATTADEAAGLPTIAEVNGKTYGLPYSINVKSLVWYDPAAFKAAGYTVPTTDDELMALQAKIIASGKGYPWCVGIASSGSNGWSMTDWFEEYVLRYGGLTQYNDWITHKILFDSPLIKKAAAKVESMIFAPGAVNGGGKAIASTDFGVAGNNLFVSGKAKGQCFMMRQGTFITDFFPKNIQAEIAKKDLTNINAFALPTPDGAVTSGTLGGGDLVGAFNTNDDTKKVVAYLTGKTFGTNGYASGFTSFISPHNDFDASKYATPFQAAATTAVKGAKAFGFDASDQMPGAVGSGTEWSNLTQWTAGQETLDQALKAIDASWPSS